MTADAETQALVRELHHRVKNNFQIIASLINLKKRMAEPSAQEEIRFIEEHVASMAVAYRLVYATGPMVEVAASELLPELVAALRVIAGVPADQIAIEGPTLEGAIELDQAIALGLFLSVSLPPYLDRALASRRPRHRFHRNRRRQPLHLDQRRLGARHRVRPAAAQADGGLCAPARRPVQQDDTSGRLSLRIMPPVAEPAGAA